MTLNRYAQRRDANEPDLVQLAKQLGCWLIKAPPLDWWLFHRGQWTPLEIKTRKGKYTKAQIEFIKNCARTGAPVLTWRSEEDVLRHVQSYQPYNPWLEQPTPISEKECPGCRGTIVPLTGSQANVWCPKCDKLHQLPFKPEIISKADIPTPRT